MFLAFRRLLRSLGFSGLVTLAAVAVVFYLVVFLGLRHTGLMPVISAAVLMAGLVATARRWGGYARSVTTTPYADVLWPLVESREEFCLILRPFGDDGEVLVPVEHRTRRGRLRRPLTFPKPYLTLEQVVAQATRTAQGLRAYALVDQKRRLAPPGPVFLRSPDDQWQIPIQEMIKRAHTIVIMLPPKQELRAAMSWELQQITGGLRQSRVILVLPPFDKRRSHYPQARRQLGAMLAVLTGLWDHDLAAVPEPLIDHCLTPIPPRTVVVKIDEDGTPRPWTVSGGRWTFVGSQPYLDALDEAVRRTEYEIRDLGFSARYPEAGRADGRPVRPPAEAPPDPPRRRINLPATVFIVVLVLATVGLVSYFDDDPVGRTGASGLRLPSLRPFPRLQTAPTAPAAGSGHACGIVDNQIRCAGDNKHGQLGTGDLRRRPTPVPIAAAPGWNEQAVGGAHTCGLRYPEATLWCWGANADGQLGLGDRTDRKVPTTVPGGERWKSIGAGRAHTCAVQADRTLWCWGDNTHGQLGLGSDRADHNRPRQVGTSTRWTSVLAARNLTCGFQNDVLWCWGTGYERLTGGSSGSSRTPVRVL